MKNEALFAAVPNLPELAKTADHIDIKTISGEVSLRQFIANMLSYNPGWVKFLYRVRWFFVRLLGMKQQGVPQEMALRPEDVSFVPGISAAFFQVQMAAENEYWFAAASESHLTAHLGVIMEPGTTQNRFHVLTLVHYHRWTGPVYFNVIRPFHHIVVGQMIKAAVKRPLRLQEA
ncbi:DUF2867 domain-containing protein [Candidatus Leptofilum sp.]|uniref:DUF2867 domain-containing protein n=1 Tax=Candidatus Leptofilum sp. TaxID=3241576 RepID=UPI003B5CE777